MSSVSSRDPTRRHQKHESQGPLAYQNSHLPEQLSQNEGTHAADDVESRTGLRRASHKYSCLISRTEGKFDHTPIHN